MKFNINGYSQPKLLEYELDIEDSLILRVVADMYVSGKMEYKIINDNKYMWCSYGYLLEQIPILGTKRTLIRKIEKLIDKEILTKEVIASKKGRAGKFLYITFGKKYSELTEYTPSDKMSSDTMNQVTNCHQPSDKMSSDQVTKCHIKDSSIIDSSITIKKNKDSSTNKPTENKLNSEAVEYKSDLEELRKIITLATGEDKFRVESIVTVNNFNKDTIKEFLFKIRDSDYLMGRKKEKPKLKIFSWKKKEILAGFYDDYKKQEAQPKENGYSNFSFDC